MFNKGYQRVKHTADIALRVHGKIIEELFENAAYGMLSFILDIENVQKKEDLTFQVKGETTEELLVNFLNQLNFLIEAEKKVFNKINVKIADNGLVCSLEMEDLDYKKHQVFRFIKAATYHNLKIQKDNKGYHTEIVFDV